MRGIRTSGAGADLAIRTPMQWTDAEGAGFTDGTPWQPINADYREVNVAAQTGDSASLLEHYRTLIQLRNTHPALQTGQTFVTDTSSNKLVSYLRASEEETLLVLINIDDVPVTDYELSLSTAGLSGNYSATSLLDDSSIESLQANASGGFDAYTPLSEIPPYAVLVIQLTPEN